MRKRRTERSPPLGQGDGHGLWIKALMFGPKLPTPPYRTKDPEGLGACPWVIGAAIRRKLPEGWQAGKLWLY